jgi:hypothetical protein
VWQFHEKTLSVIWLHCQYKQKICLNARSARLHEVSLRGGKQKIQECKNNAITMQECENARMQECKNTSSDACCPQSAGWKCMSLRILPKKNSACNLSAGWKHEFKNTASEAWGQQYAGCKCMSLWIPPQRLGASNLQAGNAWVYEYRLGGLVPAICSNVCEENLHIKRSFCILSPALQ